MKTYEPGRYVRALCDQVMGISVITVKEGTIGKLVTHYKSDYNGQWYYLIYWGRPLGEGQHQPGNIRVLPKSYKPEDNVARSLRHK